MWAAGERYTMIHYCKAKIAHHLSAELLAVAYLLLPAAGHMEMPRLQRLALMLQPGLHFSIVRRASDSFSSCIFILLLRTLFPAGCVLCLLFEAIYLRAPASYNQHNSKAGQNFTAAQER